MTAIKQVQAYPHEWGMERCQRFECEVVGTGDWMNDGDCTKHPDYRALWWTGDLTEGDGSDTNCYGEPCEPGRGYTLKTGWVDMPSTMWEVYDDKDMVSPEVYEPDHYDIEDGMTPATWLAQRIRDRLGAVDDWDGRGTLYAADAIDHHDLTKDVHIRLALHPEGFTDDEIEEALALAKA